MMNALLIIAHGSRNPEANEEVQRLALRVGRHSAGTFDRVSYAFLELADPKVESAVDGLAKAGATRIRVFPYFLAAGSHVARDIPRAVSEAQAAHPGITFEILPYLGALDGLTALIAGRLDGSGAAAS
jgi:sirohydrochlorin ferrochelatase